MNKLRDKKLGTLVGLAVGDAMGAPYEFLAKGRYTHQQKNIIPVVHIMFLLVNGLMILVWLFV